MAVLTPKSGIAQTTDQPTTDQYEIWGAESIAKRKKWITHEKIKDVQQIFFDWNKGEYIEKLVW